MAESQPEYFRFAPGFADKIADVAACWSALEYLINASIWELAEVRPALGACITSQIRTVHSRLSALLALMKLRKVESRLIKRVNKFAESVREPQELRNRIIHDQWVNHPSDQSKMGRVEIVAPKVLSMKVIEIQLTEINEDLRKVKECCMTFRAIRYDIQDALPTLPKMPHEALHPIIETPLYR